MPTYRIIHNPTMGEPIQYLGVYCLKWPWDSEVVPTVAFVEDDDIGEAIAGLRATIETQREALQAIVDLIGNEYAVCRVGDNQELVAAYGIGEVIDQAKKALERKDMQ